MRSELESDAPLLLLVGPSCALLPLEIRCTCVYICSNIIELSQRTTVWMYRQGRSAPLFQTGIKISGENKRNVSFSYKIESDFV